MLKPINQMDNTDQYNKTVIFDDSHDYWNAGNKYFEKFIHMMRKLFIIRLGFSR